MTSREERIARNEALHREVNERMRQIEEGLTAKGIVERREFDEYLCECGVNGCMETILMSAAEYEKVRSSPIRFAVRPEHVIPDVERVVEKHDRFVSVEKLVGEQAIARQTDPRS